MSDLPPQLVIGWSLWVIGGLLLTLWFVRRSRSPRPRDLAPAPPPTGAMRLSGSHAVARPAPPPEHPGPEPPATPRRGPAGHAPDPFDELRALLETPDEPPSTRTR